MIISKRRFEEEVKGRVYEAINERDKREYIDNSIRRLQEQIDEHGKRIYELERKNFPEKYDKRACPLEVRPTF